MRVRYAAFVAALELDDAVDLELVDGFAGRGKKRITDTLQRVTNEDWAALLRSGEALTWRWKRSERHTGRPDGALTDVTRRDRVQVLVLVAVVLANYLAQIPYSLDLYGSSWSGRGALLLDATFVWFAAGVALQLSGRATGYWLLLSFLEFAFHFDRPDGGGDGCCRQTPVAPFEEPPTRAWGTGTVGSRGRIRWYSPGG